MDWGAEFGCEGGPVLVANSEDFRMWNGSEPFPLNKRTALLYYSPFSRDLPKQFLQYGDAGHILIESDDPAALRKQLIAACLELFPQSSVDRSGDSWTLTRPDGKRLRASLEPSSEYSLATRTLGVDGTHVFEGARSCYLWSVEPGLVLAQVRRSHTELLLAQVYFADTDEDVAAAYEHAMATAPADDSGAIFEVKYGPVVAVWSPQSSSDLGSELDVLNAAQGMPGVVLNLATAESGVSLWMRPGRYNARTSHHEGDAWGVSWCLLTPAAEQGAASEAPTALA